jgi:small nuclear ribonucleoprotein (snRNP)-like protein
MDLVSYLDKRVHIVLLDGYFYIGKVVEADENSLCLIDKNNRRVSINKSNISLIKELAR